MRKRAPPGAGKDRRGSVAIETIIKERHLLNHPFYQRWQKGKVPIEVLEEYAKQYYAYELALPSFLENALTHLSDGPARNAVAENLADELGNPEPHAELWIRFAESLGLSRDEVRTAVPLPRTRNLVATYDSLCSRGPEEALGALYAYESQFSEVARTKADGLRRFYGVEDDKALEFFDWHSQLDEEHAAALRSALVETDLSREAVHLSIEAWWGMLDQFEAMCEAA